jgi:hypothetical protein
LRIGCALLVVFFVGNHFGKTTAVVSPHKQTLSLNETFTLHKNPKQENLGFDIIVIEDKVDSFIENGPLIYEELFAQGFVKIYNNTDKIQNLSPKTRIYNSDKKIFYLPEEALILPAKNENGPGVVEAQVVAEKPGQDYNIPPQKFTFPGFESSDDKAFNIYAESSTPFSGGFIGSRPKIQEDSLSNLQDELGNKLQERLRERLSLEKTDEFLVISGSEVFELDSLLYEDKGGQTVVSQKGKIFGLLVGKKILANYLTKNYYKLPENQEFEIINPQEISLEKKGLTDFDYLSGKTVEATLVGKPIIESRINSEFFKEQITNKTRKEIMSFIQGNPEINRAEVHIYPLWKKKSHSDMSFIDLAILNTL